MEIPEVLETRHVVGDGCWNFKLAVRDVGRLEEIFAAMTKAGRTTTSIVLSSPVPRNALPLSGDQSAQRQESLLESAWHQDVQTSPPTEAELAADALGNGSLWSLLRALQWRVQRAGDGSL